MSNKKFLNIPIASLLLVCILFCFVLLTNLISNKEDKNSREQVEYCRNEMANGCKGWHIDITDKYVSNSQGYYKIGDFYIPIGHEEYHVCYRYLRVGNVDSVWHGNDVVVSREVYAKYSVGDKYINNCTFLERDNGQK